MEPDIQLEHLTDDGVFPNNENLPVLIYKHAIAGDAAGGGDLASAFEGMFREYGWGGTWRNGIYSYHHYHSTAHEVLGVARGTARVQLGGENGITVHVEAGDVLLLPAGVAHKNLGSDAEFLVVGAYPKGQSYDMNYGREGERPAADRNIAQTPLPDSDPVYGSDGPLIEHWHE